MPKEPKKYLPLSQSTYYIMLTLLETRHGYHIMQEVERLSKGAVMIGPGTLYGALGKLEKQKMIEPVKAENEERRKYYQLTSLGKKVLLMEFKRLQALVADGREAIKEMDGEQE